MAPTSPEAMHNLMRVLPKAELHMHIEGSLEPELLFQLATRNSIELKFKDVEELRAAYDFSCLQDFLDIYYQGAGCLIKEEDFYDLGMAYLGKAHADGVVRAEVFFDPQTHTDRNIAYSVVVDGLGRACREAKEKLGIEGLLIPNILRHLSEEAALTLLDQVLHKDHIGKITGIGLDSGEKGNPPAKFANAYKKAAEAGVMLCAHAGEEGPPEYVKEALDVLKVSRIDHGVRAMEDPELAERLAKEKVPLTVCPLSNKKLCVFPDLKLHPLKKMVEAGMIATVNSDDPAYFGGYMYDNFLACYEALDLEPHHIYTLCRNSFTASWCTDEEKQAYYEALDAKYKELGFSPPAARL